MRVATVDGLFTLFYDGSKELWNYELHHEWLIACNNEEDAPYGNNEDEDTLDIESLDISVECKSYWRERLSWQQIIIMEGVTMIPEYTFTRCFNIKKVIFADTVIRIHHYAFNRCYNLVFIKLSISLEYIGPYAFNKCNLSSVFVPPRCRHIAQEAFAYNENLSILNVSQDAELGRQIINSTALAEASPFNNETANGWYSSTTSYDINRWLKHINNDEKFALHRACASFNPQKQVIQVIVQDKGLKAFQEKNSAGVTPSRYLQENPYTELTEKEIIHDYLMKMMGEVE